MPGVAPVSGPGPMSQRSDIGSGQPVRIPTGMTYGKAKQLEQMQQAVHLPQPSPSTPGPVPQGGGGAQPPEHPIQPLPPNILSILSHKTDRPGEPVTTPSGPGPTQIPLNQVIGALENMIATSDTIPASVMRLYQQLRVEASAQGGNTIY